ncbi:hypothetical protein PDESU_02649 [Pontiella desulfatans]|uniref:Uncharacterized protein n=1 Tax=Pontiella desulfatans TaxID=2750659 RepID=A0A6C2U282_PONDE|nr:hypothetical protein [Pontiella desulfatans]VGO14092.1 hypothetical protein PDESU_02649 [Pontiella desulfatans]
MNNEYEEYEDDYEDYPPRYRPPRRRLRFSLQWKWSVLALLVLALVSLRFCSGGRQEPNTELPRKQTVRVVSMSEIDLRVRAAAVSARDKAARHAEESVRHWVDGLRRRNVEFCDWYFSYLTANSLELRALGYHLADTVLVEAIAGQQPTAEERLEDVVSEAYAARVLHPSSAQLKVESICRTSVEVYLQSLSQQLSGLEAEFEIAQADWPQYLEGLSRLTLSIENGRQVPVVTKAVMAGSGIAVAKAVKVGGGQLRSLVVKAGGDRLLTGGARVGGKFVKGAGWWLAIGLTAADLIDHRHTVSVNRPVLERSLNEYLDELVQLTLYDSQTGIVPVIDGVQRDVLSRIETEDKSER